MRWLMIAALALALGGCDREDAKAPPPVQPDREAVTYFGGMILVDHLGPKAQIHLESLEEPLWFPSASDARAFTLLPGEPKDIAAIYVTDMTGADWAHPSAWIPARKATYVIGSDAQGGMGQPEAVPFSDGSAATSYAAEHGGRLVAWDDIPEDYVIPGNVDDNAAPDMDPAASAGTATQDAGAESGGNMPGMTMQAGSAPVGEKSE